MAHYGTASAGDMPSACSFQCILLQVQQLDGVFVLQINCFQGSDIVPHRTPLTVLRSLELHGACERDDSRAANYWPPEVAAPALTRLVVRHMLETRPAGPSQGMPWLSRLPMLQVCRCSAAK